MKDATHGADNSPEVLQPALRRESKRTNESYASLPEAVQRELERLAKSLFFGRAAPRRRAVGLVDMDSKGSSLWLSTGLARALSEALGETVYVLSLNAATEGSGRKKKSRHISGTVAPREDGRLEEVHREAGSVGGIDELLDRLSALLKDGRPVIVHMPKSPDQSSILAHASSLDGVVLLTHASRTRRVAIEAMHRHLTDMGVSILGSVLLDRKYPIPEKLYKML